MFILCREKGFLKAKFCLYTTQRIVFSNRISIYNNKKRAFQMKHSPFIGFSLS